MRQLDYFYSFYLNLNLMDFLTGVDTKIKIIKNPNKIDVF